MDFIKAVGEGDFPLVQFVQALADVGYSDRSDSKGAKLEVTRPIHLPVRTKLGAMSVAFFEEALIHSRRLLEFYQASLTASAILERSPPSQWSHSFLPSEDTDEIGGTRKPTGPSDFGYIVFGPLE
jgi:hypothetical protein